jgi:hypothetical protein
MTGERDPQGMTRRQLIRHSAWFGAAVVLTVASGEVISHVAGSTGAAKQHARPALRFAQISDSHIGFTGAPNPNVAGTFTEAINQVNSLGYTPDFVIHTGDLTHLSTPEQFYLKRFSSVTCLNGHVHQLFTKTDGNITFYTATTTAYPLPHPGDGPAPKPVTLPAGKLHDALGIREVSFTKGQQALAIKEQTLQ